MKSGTSRQYTSDRNSLVAQMVKVCRQCRRTSFDPWVGKIPWRRIWQTAPLFLPGESYGQRSLAGYSPWGRKESDTTKRLHFTSYKQQTLYMLTDFPGGTSGRESTSQCRTEDTVLIPGSGRSPGGGNGNPPSILALKISWTEEPVGLWSKGWQRVGYD